MSQEVCWVWLWNKLSLCDEWPGCKSTQTQIKKRSRHILRTHSQRSCSLNQSPIPPCCYLGETSCSPSYLEEHVFTQVHCGWFPPSGVFITVPTTLPAEDLIINHSQLQVSSAFQGKAFPWKVPSKHLASQTPVTSLAPYCLPIPLTPEGASSLWVPHLCYRRPSHHQPAGFASWLSQFPDMIISPPIPSQGKSHADSDLSNSHHQVSEACSGQFHMSAQSKPCGTAVGWPHSLVSWLKCFLAFPSGTSICIFSYSKNALLKTLRGDNYLWRTLTTSIHLPKFDDVSERTIHRYLT